MTGRTSSRMISLQRLILCAIVCCLVVTMSSEGQAKETKNGTKSGSPYTIAVVVDGPSPVFEEIIADVRKDISVVLESDQRVIFPEKYSFSAGWDVSRVAPTMEKALKTPEVDAVLALGYHSLKYASSKPPAKPVIGGMALDRALAKKLYNPQSGRTGTKNFNCVLLPVNTSSDLSVFDRMTDFDTLAVVADNSVAADPAFKRSMKRYSGNLGAETVFISGTSKTKAILERIKSSNADAVYFCIPFRMSSTDQKQLFTGCNNLRLPTFSQAGAAAVKQGVLAGQRQAYRDRLARQLSLNLKDIIGGQDPRSLSVPITVGMQLTINAATADKIGFRPGENILLEADFIEEKGSMQGNRPITLKEAFSIVLKRNPRLAMQAARVNIKEGLEEQAMSGMLPQVEGQAHYRQVRHKVAANSEGEVPEHDTTVGVEVRQMIFNDEIISDYHTAGERVKAGKQVHRATRLDILRSTAVAYLELLHAEHLRVIAMEDLRLTRKNTKIARDRQEAGSVGPEHVYRWKVKESTQKAALLEANKQRQQALHELNRILGRRSNVQWQPQDITVGEKDSYFLEKELKKLLHNRGTLASFRRFVVQEAIKKSPLLSGIEYEITARNIQLDAHKRSFYVPDIGASFRYSHIVDREMTGFNPGPEPVDNKWTAMLTLTIPIFEGGRRFAEVATDHARLRRLRDRRRRTRHFIMKRARNVCSSLAASYPSIRWERQAADSAKANLKTVREKYKQGEVSILDLLDAQNQAFTARERAAIAVNDYLVDIHELQRIVCWFQHRHTKAETEQWLNKLQKYLHSHP